MPRLKLVWVPIVGGLLVLLASTGWAQESARQPTAPPKIKLDEPPAAKGVIERVDGVFSTIVGWMYQGLFYRIGSSEQTFVVMDHMEHYVRDRGSEGPFLRHHPQGTYDADQITLAEAQALAAQGKLIMGTDAEGKPRVFRFGKIGDREVEYVTIVIDTSSRYVLVEEGGKFHKQLAKRSLLSDEITLTREKVDELAALGRLKTEETRTGEEIYVFTATDGNTGMPLVVAWLALGAVSFTIYFRGFNLWGFKHSIEVVRGKYDNPDEAGEVSHFQALASALSATVGLGNIAGVTIAITTGGPGAFFWMMLCGFFGMTSKFVECTLGQKYRLVKPDGTVQGGPMRYLHEGLKELGLGPLGAVLAAAFTIMCILASFGGGNMFQANQSGGAVVALVQRTDARRVEELNGQIRDAAENEELDRLGDLQAERAKLLEEMGEFETIFRSFFGVVMAAMVALVIVGGIKRIGAAAEKIVPTMCGMYLLCCIVIIGLEIQNVPAMVGLIFSEAFSGHAFGGGLIGVAVIGIQRAAFSNEAGVGSASIAHSAAKTEEPVREGVVALMEPFIDTIVVCSMTALVIMITGAWNNNDWVDKLGLQGAALTSRAFEEEIGLAGPIFLAVATVLFAYSTIISWSYYGERSWEQLFGLRSTFVYKILAIGCVLLGAVANLGAVLDFSDMMILSMAFPNILGLALLAPKVKRDLDEYWSKYKSGQFKTYK